MSDYVSLEEDLDRSVPGSPYILDSAKITRAYTRPHISSDMPLLTDVLHLELGDRSRLAVPSDALHADVRLYIPDYRAVYLREEEMNSDRVVSGEAGRDIKRAAMLWASGLTREEYYRIPREVSEVFCYLATHNLFPLSVQKDRDYRDNSTWFFIRYGLSTRGSEPVSVPEQSKPAVQSSPTIQTPKRTITINKRR